MALTHRENNIGLERLKSEIFLIITALVWLGVQGGFFPIFIGIFTTVFTGISFLWVFGEVFRGTSDDLPSTIANTTTGFTVSYQKFIQKQTWNCKNCGGPNVEQIACQYCGKVKE